MFVNFFLIIYIYTNNYTFSTKEYIFNWADKYFGLIKKIKIKIIP